MRIFDCRSATPILTPGGVHVCAVQMLEAMCLTGLIPNVIKFSGAQYPLGIRREAARLVHYFSMKALAGFIACGGMRCPTYLLASDYNKYQTLVAEAKLAGQ